MQYLLSVLDSGAGMGTPEEMAAVGAFNERLMANGHWVFAGGLEGPEAATVVDNRADAGLIIDGPFIESKEYLAGFWVIEAPDLDVAITLATEGSKHCNRRVEVRPFGVL